MILRTGELLDGETHPYLFNIQDYFEDKTLTLLKREDTRAKDILSNVSNAIDQLDRTSNIYELLNFRRPTTDAVID